MDEIYIRVIKHSVSRVKSVEQLASGVADGVPPHLRNLQTLVLRTESHHIRIEYAKTVRIALCAMAAHQLHADADAQHRLLQILDEQIEFMLLQVCHSAASFALSRENHPVGFADYFRVGRDLRHNAQSPDGIVYRTNIPCVIFYYSYVHQFVIKCTNNRFSFFCVISPICGVITQGEYIQKYLQSYNKLSNLHCFFLFYCHYTTSLERFVSKMLFESLFLV
jgi:hypothetical protein